MLPPAWPPPVPAVVPLPAPVCVAGAFSAGGLGSGGSFFARTIFFFSGSRVSDFFAISSFSSIFGFDFGFGEAFAFATVDFFGEGFGVGFGVGLGVGFGVALTFGAGFGVVDGVVDGLAVASGSWISLGAEVNSGRSSSSSLDFSLRDSRRSDDFSRGDGFFSSVTIPSPAPPFIQTTL